ncbi:hypothetical protein GS905_11760 [Rhodococcus hoagii]|uniref:hypothetical protein n=1 Tax=Rhodococcus hoagii TaxID=43767 RepID=UPI000A10E077|nr:hypothetical protein [Prescottella equi]MBM4570338.1 hypothetical protein [Prescottella equi]MBM4570348.1 hypothetical protein [Prescottella equi]MBM4615106.1 hypothetical protein [Prescottella equi]MBM4702463.1 hypothetical protein [Prescottella equi]NKU69019.1 hypothetical protein [Prescottella equi]
MSTAEQIIAEALVQWSLEPCCGTCAGGLAAHVVAALTNAGKTIVELPEVAPGDITIGVVSALHDYGVIDIETSPDFVRIFESTGWYSAEAMTFLGSALIAVAAARVAEGGDQP